MVEYPYTTNYKNLNSNNETNTTVFRVPKQGGGEQVPMLDSRANDNIYIGGDYDFTYYNFRKKYFEVQQMH